MSQPKLSGVTVRLAEKDYIVPPLNFKGWQDQESLIRDFWKTRSTVLASKDESVLVDAPFITKYLPIVHAALIRNYPEVKLDQLADELTIDDADAVSKALVAALNSGKQQSAPGEAKAVAS